MQLLVRQATLGVVFNKTDAWCRLTAVRDGNALHTWSFLNWNKAGCAGSEGDDSDVHLLSILAVYRLF
jgi:hypothetical protein